MTPIVEMPALMYIDLGGGFITKQVMLLGIDEKSFTATSATPASFYSTRRTASNWSFELREGGYDQYDHTVKDPDKIRMRPGMQDAGWEYRRTLARSMKQLRQLEQATGSVRKPGELANPFDQATGERERRAGERF